MSIHVVEPTQPSHLRTAAASEFCEMLSALGIAQRRVAQLFGDGPRSARRLQYGDRHIPYGVNIVLRLLAGIVTVAQVEQAASAIPARTNGSVEPEPSLVEPAPEPSVVADVKAAAFTDPASADPASADPASADPASADPTFADPASADPGLTTTEKVCALAPEACRWPYGDPRHPDFRFCGRPITRKPYCGQHHSMAHVVSSTSSRPGFGAARRRRRLW
jgi:hypothetical protein